MRGNLVLACAAAALGGQAIAERKREESLCKTTVWVKVEVMSVAGVSVAPVVAEALNEFVKAGPSTRQGKFESTAGADVSWFVKDELVDGKPVQAPMVGAVNDALTACAHGTPKGNYCHAGGGYP